MVGPSGLSCRAGADPSRRRRRNGRSGIRGILESHAYRVVGAESGQAALARLRTTPTIDLVLTDAVLPEMNGVQMTALAWEPHPDLCVLYGRGYRTAIEETTGPTLRSSDASGSFT